MIVYFVNERLDDAPRALSLFATVPVPPPPPALRLQAAAGAGSSPFEARLAARMDLVFTPSQPSASEATVRDRRVCCPVSVSVSV